MVKRGWRQFLFPGERQCRESDMQDRGCDCWRQSTGINWAMVESSGKGCSYGAFINLCIENMFDTEGVVDVFK